ncbi:tripartite tricarboxylate transporter substrate binding protein [Comamonas endophytica]|uniref:Tripartite tricarboxylate transporter substrate binding protein n=1 Tax=Comamonas endophytica TaxID=2949090 RepID=A0ABY6GGM4_9BURK|nr:MULTISPECIES: tripartite tricarboxylate transporter substrate binding protein [unclassified Acidovorax]MCD2514276.1 tripartite tricarboxylate transporter substrate binding protein [Acidovorax sp. D4N7]UYG53527.1 tripartite tricarboxylate transporter substrate binding protein [Acidovorax sp. 5MLIR]
MQRRSLALGLAALALAPAVQAQTDFPNKPVRLVVTYPPGGTVDVAARILATKLTELWGQSVVVDNRGGAGGIIGAQAVLSSPADGYTLMVDASNHAQNAALKKRMPFDTLKAFAPVSLLVKVPNVLVIHPRFPAQSAKDVVAYAKANPGKLDYASSGNGSAQHLAAELFALKTGAPMTHVAYRGGGPALVDVMAGNVPVFFASLASSLPHIQSGKLKPLAVAGTRRSPVLPDTPTFVEAGVAGVDVYEWNGLFAPASTPPALVEKISKDVAAALNDREIKAKLMALGAEVIGSTPREADQFRRSEISQWTALGKRANISLD